MKSIVTKSESNYSIQETEQENIVNKITHNILKELSLANAFDPNKNDKSINFEKGNFDFKFRTLNEALEFFDIQ